MTTALDLAVQISLDGSGDYTGTNDDVTAYVAVAPGIQIDEGREGARALLPPKGPALSFELRNEQGLWSQENPGGPAYQQLLPGRPVRIVSAEADHRTYRSHTAYRAPVRYSPGGAYSITIASGAIDEIVQTTEPGQQRVAISNLGTLSTLLHQDVTVPIQTTIRTDEAIELLLDEIGWPSGLRDISIGDTTLTYWWCDERRPWDAILELLASEGPCQFYQDAEGVLHFENRNYRAIATRSTVSQASYADVDTGGLWFTGLSYDPGFKSVHNRATYSTKRRTLGALAKVWEYGASLVLTANQSVTLIVRPTDPFQNAVTPAAATDYTVSAGSLSAVTLSATSGLVAFLTITAGASGATVNGVTSTGIQLRAQPLSVLSETVAQNGVDASESITKYSPIPGVDIPRTLNVQGWPEIEPIGAQAVCDAWVNRYMEQHPQVSIMIRNADLDHLYEILNRQVSDRISLTDANTGISADVWIESKQIKISGAGGRTIECILGCELTSILTGAIWDVSEWDDPSAEWGI
jgi:hypothetical protein